jgi:O-antigen/teichoic acid export membrane protein
VQAGDSGLTEGTDRSAANREPRASSSMLGGSSLLAVTRYVGAGIGFVTNVIIIHSLSESDFGRYSYIFSLLAIVGLVSELRLSRAVLSSVMDAREQAGKIIGSYALLRLLISVVTYVVFLAIVVVSGNSNIVIAASALIGTSLIIAAWLRALALLCEARLWFRTLAVSMLAGFIAQGIATVIIAIVHGTVVTFMLAAIANFVVQLLYVMWALRGQGHLRLRWHRNEWWPWLKEAAPLSLGNALDTIYFRIDIVMLPIIASFSAAGFYGVGYKFSDLLGGAIPIAVLTPMLTLMVETWPHEIERFQRTFRHAVLLLSITGVAAGVGFAILARPVIVSIYGARYEQSSTAAVWLVVGQVLHFYTALCFTTLMAVKRNFLYPVAMLIGVVINVLLNLVLIPRYSYTGSGVATVLTEIIVLAVLVFGVARIPDIGRLPVRPLMWIAVAGAVMAGVMLALNTTAPWVVTGIVGGLVFLAVLHFSKFDGPRGIRAVLDTEIVKPSQLDLAEELEWERRAE